MTLVVLFPADDAQAAAESWVVAHFDLDRRRSL